ncbi:MAG: hypothetical protein ACQEQG_09470, partial [Bacillota bacterium]
LLLILPSIIPLIAFHFLYDALALMTGSGAEQRHTLILGILTTLYVLYGIYLVGVLGNQRRKALSFELREE